MFAYIISTAGSILHYVIRTSQTSPATRLKYEIKMQQRVGTNVWAEICQLGVFF